MNGKWMATIGIGACAAACSAGLLIPFLAGGSIALGLGAFLGGKLETLLCLAVFVAIAGVAFVFYRRRNNQQACATDKSCGCGPMKEAIES